MSVVTLHPLIDGALSADPRTERASLVARMAKVLIKNNSYVDERSAMRSLRPHFELGDIAVLIDDARQVAMQHVVAREISET